MSDDPDSPATAEDLRAAEILATWRREEPSRVRASAGKWQAGLAAVLALVTTVLVFRGPETLAGLDRTSTTLVVALTLAGVGASVAGLVLSLLAAHGLPVRQSNPSTAWILGWDARQARTSLRSLYWAIGFSLAGGALFAAAAAVSYLEPRSPGQVVWVELSNGTPACGPLVRADSDHVVLTIDGVPHSFSTSRVESMEIRDGCVEEP